MEDKRAQTSTHSWWKSNTYGYRLVGREKSNLPHSNLPFGLERGNLLSRVFLVWMQYPELYAPDREINPFHKEERPESEKRNSLKHYQERVLNI